MGREARRNRSAVKEAATRDPAYYGYYLVAFIDVLGQQEEIAKLVALPHATESRDAVLDILKRTTGRVAKIRRNFGNYFRTAGANQQSLRGLTAEQVREYNKMRTLTFHQVGFSDSFVIAVPLGEREFGPATAALGVWAALFGLAGMSLAAMAEGIPLRAGIDVERAIAFFPNEVYGPALVNAYQLESRVAAYPRGVVGDGLLRYLAYLEEPRSNGTKWTAMSATLAERCRRLICEDPSDGQAMLHMLSPDILSLGEQFTEPAKMAYEWADAEAARFVAAGDQKHAPRYEKLVAYFRAFGFPSQEARNE